MSDLQPVPFFDLARLLEPLRPALHDALERCLRHGTFVLGPEVQQFEAQLADYLGLPHVIGVSSGTDALLATFLVAFVPVSSLFLLATSPPTRPAEGLRTGRILCAFSRTAGANRHAGARSPGRRGVEWRPRRQHHGPPRHPR